MTLSEQVAEAQHIVDLANKEGFFDCCYPRDWLYVYGRKEARRRLSERIVELLAGQYQELKWDLERMGPYQYRIRMRVRYPHERKT